MPFTIRRPGVPPKPPEPPRETAFVDGLIEYSKQPTGTGFRRQFRKRVAGPSSAAVDDAVAAQAVEAMRTEIKVMSDAEFETYLEGEGAIDTHVEAAYRRLRS